MDWPQASEPLGTGNGKGRRECVDDAEDDDVGADAEN